MNNKNKILALILVLLVMVLGGASLYISAKLNTQEAVAPNAPASEPRAFECDEKCPAPNGELWNCHPTESDGSEQKSICNAAGRVESCGGQSYCCPAPGGAWTTDMTQCPSASPTATLTSTPIVWVGSAACAVDATAASCTPTGVITCSPDCPTACSTAASTITTCTNSCGVATTKQCAATAACGTADVSISKTAYKDETDNTAGVYVLTREISSVSKNQVFIYAMTIKNNGTATASSVVVTDTLNGEHQDLLTVVDKESRCTLSENDRKLTCSGLTLNPGASTTLTFRLRVSEAAANGDVIKNTGIVTYNGNTKEAKKDLTVSTVVSCNNTCTADSECGDGLTCNGATNSCRRAACSAETDCSCPITSTPTGTPTVTATGTPQPTILPEAGILDIPGVAAFGGGLLLAIIGIMLAL